MIRLPHIPHVKTRAPATSRLVHHFLTEGWLGQLRPKGDLVKILVSASGGILFSQDRLTGKLDPISINLLQSLFRPHRDWNAFLSVRQQGTTNLWILDCLIEEGAPLLSCTLADRLGRMPHNFISPIIKIAPSLKTAPACNKALDEGHDILFRHITMPGWCQDGMVLLTSPRN